jgi:hypothetical protein
MASRGKKKNTMAKLSRESRLRERRQEKAAKKDARRYAAENPPPADENPELGDSEFATDETELGSPVTAGEPADPA